MNINFFDSTWDIFSAFAVFAIGFIFFGSRPFQSVSSKLSIFLYCWHSLFCLYFAWFALFNTADAIGYFQRSLSPDVAPAIGTRGVDFLTSIFTQFLGLSYFGAFLVFNVIGAFGVLAVLAAIRETTREKTKLVRIIATLICFLPGINFWTVAIGKDPLSILGTGLICWAAIDISKRWFLIVVGTLCYLLVRPHIVPVIMAAFLFYLLVFSRMKLAKKGAIIAVLAMPTFFVIQFAILEIGLGESSQFDGFDDFVEYRQSVNLDGSSSVDISGMILTTQMFYYAFMPLFAGVGGLLGLVASIENVFLIIIVMISLPGIMRGSSTLKQHVKWFYFFLVSALWIIFAITTANTGLALRQKWMFMPMLLLVCLSYMPTERRR